MLRDENKDLEILATAVVSKLFVNDCEYGAIGVDPKRPFGNSDVTSDILKMIGWEMEGDDGEDPCYSRQQREYARSLYTEKVIPYMQAQWKSR